MTNFLYCILFFFTLFHVPFFSLFSTENKKDSLPEEILFGIPAKVDQSISRQGFSLGYSYKYRQAVWVSYTLTEEKVKNDIVKRRPSFRIDPAIKFAPVRPKDYTGTGYDKGHLAPAADMAWSVLSMKNSFYMSNISPQIPGCNRGIWKRVEKTVRQWAVKEKKLCIITGPVFHNTNKLLPNTAIPIPTAFYKVVLDMTPPMKMIGFLVPNAASKKRVFAFAVPVDKVEEVTKYDFFSALDDEIENKIEKECNILQWTN